MNLADLRREYKLRQLRKENLSADPIQQFLLWFEEAKQSEVLEPNAMVLATSSKSGIVSSRTVLLKHIDSEGLYFFTNYESRKARDMRENSNVSVTFLWKELERQVTVQGIARKTSRELSIDYFSKRPRQSQLGAAASHQSQEIESRTVLEKEFARLEDVYKNKEVETPEEWGGYIIKPLSYEFWQGRESRLHDRFMYARMENENWKIVRLSP